MRTRRLDMHHFNTHTDTHTAALPWRGRRWEMGRTVLDRMLDESDQEAEKQEEGAVVGEIELGTKKEQNDESVVE